MIDALPPDDPLRISTQQAQRLLDWQRARAEAEHARVQVQETRARLADTWERFLKTRESLRGDRNLHRATLNLLEDTEHAQAAAQHEAAERHASEEKYRLLFNLMDQAYGVGQVLFDAENQPVDFRWLDVNPQFEPVTGLPREQVLGGLTMSQVAPDMEPDWVQIYGQVAISGTPVRFEKWCAALGRWFDVYAFRIGEPELRRVAVLCSNITRRKQAEEALERNLRQAEEARRQIQAASEAKDRFLAILSHELRTPLTPVLMIAGALAEDETLSDEVRDDIAMIRRNVEIETRLIDDLLDMNRLAVGKLNLRLSTVALDSLVHETCGICQPAAIERAVEVEFTPGCGSTCLSADPVRLQQAVWNVLRNAIKFTPKHGRVEVSTASAGGCCTVRVRDSGIGIRPEILPTIFSAFEQGDDGITRRYGGLGLGLAITKGLVELHGGTIRAESAGPGHGATFTLEFPVL